jgi:hypothetical protein
MALFQSWMSDMDDFDGLRVSDTSEVPDDYSGEVLHVNDHGNATLYVADNGSINIDTLLETREGIIYGLAFGDERYDTDTLVGALVACERMIIEMVGITKKKTKAWCWPPVAGGE